MPLKKTHKLRNWTTQKLTPLKTHVTQKRVNLQTKQLKNSRPKNLKILHLILQNTTRAPTPSSEDIGRDAGKNPLFLPFYVFRLVLF